jgi:hypothetical protein
MSSSTKINCLKRLQDHTGGLNDILQFLSDEQLMAGPEVQKIRVGDLPKNLVTVLAKLSAEGKLQLLEYEWIVLPVERIKIFILTDRSSKEFTYNF